MKKKILVVDDEQDILNVVTARLQHIGYEVYNTVDSREVFALVEKHRPDLILIDILMPNLTGAEVVKALKTKEGFKNIPVVFLSAAYDDLSSQGDESLGINIEGVFYPAVGKPSYHLLEVIRKNLL